MGLYIKNWSLADWKELLTWAKIGANNAMIGEFTEVEEVPPHGKLIDADALTYLIGMNEHFSTLEAMYLMGLIADAPTIIPAEEGE